MAFFLFDTSALVKRYHVEVGSDKVDEIFDDPDNVLIISELAIVEVTSALQRKRNQGEITQLSLISISSVKTTRLSRIGRPAASTAGRRSAVSGS